jgi:N-acylneuraminate cytidylyltransferase
MGIVAFIFARGGSKGLPGKNILPLHGKPLIAWSIDQAKLVDRIERIIVSTDSIEIAEVARQFGAEVPFLRPADLAQDTTPEWHVWQHALNYLKETEGTLPSTMISIPTTSPLRLPCDLEKCIDEYQKGDVDAVITIREAQRSPYFNMVTKREDGTVSLVMSSEVMIARRQDTPIVYDMTTVAYVLNPKFVLEKESLFQGRVRAVEIPVERSLDIDNLIDFKLAEVLSANMRC